MRLIDYSFSLITLLHERSSDISRTYQVGYAYQLLIVYVSTLKFLKQ